MINNKKMKTFSEGEAASVRSHTSSAKGKERHIAKSNIMSSDTKYFIQKICYRKTASIDMTQYGFITDSKVNPVNNYVINPLRVQLEKIRVKPAVLKHRPLLSPSRTNAREVVSPAKLKPSCPSQSVKQQCPLPSPSRTKSRVVVNTPLLCGSAERKPSSSQAYNISHPKSALSHPGTHSSRACVRKVRIQSDPIPSPVTSKQVTRTLASPRTVKRKKKL